MQRIEENIPGIVWAETGCKPEKKKERFEADGNDL